MLDMKFVRDNPEKVMEAVRKRNGELNLDEFLALAAPSGIRLQRTMFACGILKRG